MIGLAGRRRRCRRRGGRRGRRRLLRVRAGLRRRRLRGGSCRRRCSPARRAEALSCGQPVGGARAVVPAARLVPPAGRAGRPALLRGGLLAWLLRACGTGNAWMTGRMYSRAVWPRLRASLLSFPGTVITRLSPSITTSEPDTPSPLTREADDLLGLVQRLGVGARSVGRARGQCDPGATLQVDAQLRPGLLVAGQEDQQVHADQQREEECQVAGRVHRRRRRCHVSLVSSMIGSSAPQRVRAGAESPTVSR